jgi:RHS repeat-associated protein
LQKIPIIEKKQVVNFVKISSFSQCLCGFFALKCSQDDVGNLVTTVVNNRNAEYESNLVNQYVQRAIPNVLDIYGQRYAGSEVLVNDQTTQRRNRYFYTTQTVENSVFAVPLVVEVKTDGAVDESRTAFVPKNPEAFVHDDRGNLIKDGQWNYSWNGLNQLVGMETRNDVGVSPIVKLAFAYDSEGRRWKKTVWKDGVFAYERRFLYDGFNLIAELDGNNAVLKTYTWGTDLSGTMQGAGGVGGLLSMTDHVTGNSYFYLHDGNGNVVGLVDSVSGVVVKEYEYGPFGKVLVETDAGSGVAVENSFGFSGKYLDAETGLSYYGYRYYSSEMGRWISRDPAGEDKGGRNLYGFCGNDPINGVDVLGRWKILDIPFISAPRHEALSLSALYSSGVLSLYYGNESANKKLKDSIVAGVRLVDMPDGIATSLTILGLNDYGKYILGPLTNYVVQSGIADTETFATHYGPNQYWHAMVYNETNPASFRLKMISWIVGLVQEFREKGDCFDMMKLGMALHTIQDSYSKSHVQRTNSYEILGYQAYNYQDHSEHGIADKENVGDPMYERALRESSEFLSMVILQKKSINEIGQYLLNNVFVHSTGEDFYMGGENGPYLHD